MVKDLEAAIAKIASLPASDQEDIGRRLLSHVKRLDRLRREIDKGIQSLEAGGGEPLDIGEFLRAKHSPDGSP